MPYEEIPAFLNKLCNENGTSSLALEFTVHTAARTNETLGATWAEFDLDKGLWTIPAERMKGGVEHIVPLSSQTLKILEKAKGYGSAEYVFPGAREGRPLSNMSMNMLMRRMGIAGVTVHGFRSSFRDWCGDQTDYSREVAEAALAHKIGNKVE